MGRLRILVVLAITLGLDIPTAGADTFLLKAIRQAPPNARMGFKTVVCPRLSCGLDIENCQHSGGAANVIAIIEDSAVIKRISSSFTVGRGLFLALPDFRKTRAYVSYL